MRLGTIAATSVLLALAGCGGFDSAGALREHAGAVERFKIPGDYRQTYKNLVANLNECAAKSPAQVIETRLSEQERAAYVDISAQHIPYTRYMHSVVLRPADDGSTDMQVYRWRDAWGPKYAKMLESWASKPGGDCEPQR